MSDAALLRRVEMLEETVESLRALPGEVRDLRAQIVQLRIEMGDGFSAIRTEFQTDLTGAVRELTGAIVETRAELVRHTQVLHEDVIKRIKILDEG